MGAIPYKAIYLFGDCLGFFLEALLLSFMSVRTEGVGDLA
jgi:hypothetical protein